MRRAVITIHWEGPDKKVRELIDDAIDDLFMRISFIPAVTVGDTAIEFTSKVKS